MRRDGVDWFVILGDVEWVTGIVKRPEVGKYIEDVYFASVGPGCDVVLT